MHVVIKTALGCSRVPFWQTHLCCITFGLCLAFHNLLQAFFLFFLLLPSSSYPTCTKIEGRWQHACSLPCTWHRCDSVEIISNAGLILLCWLSVIWAEMRDCTGFDICGFYSIRVLMAVWDVFFRHVPDNRQTINANYTTPVYNYF